MNDKKKIYNRILYSKNLEFTYHSKIKTRFLQKEKKSYASYETYNPSKKSKQQSK